MTDGRLYYGAQGEAMKAFDVRDGHGLRLLQMHAGVKLAALTGRRADLVLQRCRELSIDHVVGQSRAKGQAIGEIAQTMSVPLEQVCFMGDDVNDLPALRRVGLPCAPADAVPEVLREVSWWPSTEPATAPCAISASCSSPHEPAGRPSKSRPRSHELLEAGPPGAPRP